jgi:4-amino-4-deoxy-L-arabinose transferase-like glycosyltransferase
MRTVDDIDLAAVEYQQGMPRFAVKPFRRIDRNMLTLVLLLVAVGLAARFYNLDAAGLAEDEATKLAAVNSYSRGDFTANAEHPMLMKWMCFASVKTAELWNRTAGPALSMTMSPETAIRLPNAVFGALTVVPLFLLASSLLGFRAGLITGVLWALGLEAIWFNRIAKEDTLMVFFAFSGYCLYNLAKRHAEADPRISNRLFALAGAAFGLMLSSKYFPQYFALNQVYYTLIGYDSRNNRPVGRKRWGYFFAAMIPAFLITNPALFLPGSWSYLLRYVNKENLAHHGYLVMDTLFMNDMSATPGGNPWYFYLLFFGVKIPLPLLIAFAVGLIEIFRHRGAYPQSRGYLFLRLMLVFWLLPMSLVGTKFLRYTLFLMPLVYMTSAIGAIVLWKAAVRFMVAFNIDWLLARRVAAVWVSLVVVGFPSFIAARSIITSHPGLYVNALGGGRVGYFFPHDEFYDLGARESIRYIADTAPRGARLASEIPGVVDHYLKQYGRTDIESVILSHPEFDLNKTKPDYALVQRGRVYVENQASLKVIQTTWLPVQTSSYQGAATSQVYSAKDPPPGREWVRATSGLSDKKTDRPD